MTDLLSYAETTKRLSYLVRSAMRLADAGALVNHVMLMFYWS